VDILHFFSEAVSLDQLFLDFEERLGVTITFHDRVYLFRDSNHRSLLNRRMGHLHPFCRWGRKPGSAWDRQCYEDCFPRVNAQIVKRPTPFCKRCWKGATEIVVPLMRDGVHVATLFCGPYRGHGKEKTSPSLNDHLEKLPKLETKTAEALARLLQSFGQGLVRHVSALQQATSVGLGRRGEIQQFLRDRAHHPIALGDLAKRLSLSPSRTSHLVREIFGQSFSDLLMEERLERVGILLVTSRLTLA